VVRPLLGDFCQSAATGVYAPLPSSIGPLRYISELSPATYVLRGVRSELIDGTGPDWGAVAILVVMACFFILLGCGPSADPNTMQSGPGSSEGSADPLLRRLDWVERAAGSQGGVQRRVRACIRTIGANPNYARGLAEIRPVAWCVSRVDRSRAG